MLCQRRSYEYREHPLSIEFDLAPFVGSMIGRVGGVVMFRFVSQQNIREHGIRIDSYPCNTSGGGPHDLPHTN